MPRPGGVYTKWREDPAGNAAVANLGFMAEACRETGGGAGELRASRHAFHDLNFHHRSRHDIALIGRQDNEAIGFRHRAQDA